MKLDKSMRDAMLATVRAALLDAAADQLIKFYTSGDVLLCSVEFKDIDTYNSGDRRAIRFKAMDNSYVLRQTTSASGFVSKFSIQGKPAGAIGVIDKMITGTVGGFGSTTSDILFNKTIWSSNTTIAINNLSIAMLQGS